MTVAFLVPWFCSVFASFGSGPISRGTPSIVEFCPLFEAGRLVPRFRSSKSPYLENPTNFSKDCACFDSRAGFIDPCSRLGLIIAYLR
ncbi:hypothetical protein BJX64DRAFT_68416 [Aspergillus heterothallicus]